VTGYTTFSWFGRETIALIQQGNIGRAGLYMLLSNLLGLLGVWVGILLVTHLWPSRS
jgi:CrcB protein